MPEINASKFGRIVGTTAPAQPPARDASSGVHHDETSGESIAIQWFRSSGRGGGTFRYIRTFLYFDVSSITSTVSSATLKVAGHGTHSDADIIAVKSTAFGGDGGTDLADDDFNNVTFSTAYSAELSIWTNSDFNNFVLNSTAKTDIQNDNFFIVALIEYDSDYLDVDTSDGSFEVGIDFSVGKIVLDLTLAGYSHTVIGVAPSNISTVKGVSSANIDTVIGVD